MVRKLLVFALLLPVFISSNVMVTRAAGDATPNDVARFLAGLQTAANSPIASYTRLPAWQRHAASMSNAWTSFERRQVTRIRVWSGAKLTAPRQVMFYMFGGPDFIHADAFFPKASTYVLSGLEPIGSFPDVSKWERESLASSLGTLKQSLNNFLQYGYFITREMGTQLKNRNLNGVLPVLYVFLARSGKTISQTEFVSLNGHGNAVPVKGKRKPSGVRISYSGQDGKKRTLYYFRTDLSNGGVRKSGFLKFCAKLGQGDSLIKSASYLLHQGNFSEVRKFLLDRSSVIVQDDSGIPVKYFLSGKWRLRPFGRYIRPTDEFKRHYQSELVQIFQSGGAQQVNFGIGYRWHPQRTNILVANRPDSKGLLSQ